MRFLTRALIIGYFLFAVPVKAQQPPKKLQILFLGTTHFAGSSDLLGLDMSDISSSKRQQEIKQLVNKLARFKPTKVILEYPYGNMKMDSTYRQYLDDNHALTNNERQQLGFRLARNLGHDHVYAADKRMGLNFDAVMQFLEERNRKEEFNQLVALMKAEVINPMQEHYNRQNLANFFNFINRDENDRMTRMAYLQYFNRYSTPENPAGINLTARWWKRNFHIMANIDRIAEPGDRVLVIFGQGHTALLKQFYQDRQDVDVVPVNDYL
jgi:hypothetical protein